MVGVWFLEYIYIYVKPLVGVFTQDLKVCFTVVVDPTPYYQIPTHPQF